METESPPVDYNSDDLKAKIDLLKEKLGITEVAKEETLTDEAQLARLEAEPEPEQSPITGKDVDWDDYDLPKSLEHLYKKAELKNTEDGPKWIVALDEFHSASKMYNSDRVNKKGESESLGGYITQLVNSHEGWRIATVLPNGAGMGAVLFQRRVPFVLPDPVPLDLGKVDVAPLTDEELLATEADALKWAGLDANKAADEALGALEGEDFGQLEQPSSTGEEESV